ncbi:MAG: hypothetical protein WC867_02055 [Candidatus Pacearchaeota archaeon]|jgi:hypothetical protein
MVIKTIKSQGHIEMIVSFFLFIISLVVIFYLLNPAIQSSTKTPDPSRISGIIVKNLSYEYGKLVIILKDDSDYYEYTPEVYIGDQSSSSEPIRYYEKKDFPDTKYVVYFSKFFEENFRITTKYGCPAVIPPDPEIDCEYNNASYSIEKFVVYEEIKKIKEQYDSDYNKLKRELGINRDFSFSVRSPNGVDISEVSISPKRVPAGKERGSFDIPIRVINKTADIRELIINVKSW